MNNENGIPQQNMQHTDACSRSDFFIFAYVSRGYSCFRYPGKEVLVRILQKSEYDLFRLETGGRWALPLQKPNIDNPALGQTLMILLTRLPERVTGAQYFLPYYCLQNELRR